MQDTFNLKGESTDEIGEEIIPVLIVEPQINIVRSSATVNVLSVTLFTTPTDKDFFLTSINLSAKFKTGGASTVVRFVATIDGVLNTFIRLVNIAGEGTTTQMSIPFQKPIKVDRGSVISAACDVAEVNTAYSGGFTGYTVETTKNS
jgi:hypothetical protein